MTSNKSTKQDRHILRIDFTREEAELIEWVIAHAEGFIGLKGEIRKFNRLKNKITTAVDAMYG